MYEKLLPMQTKKKMEWEIFEDQLMQIEKKKGEDKYFLSKLRFFACTDFNVSKLSCKERIVINVPPKEI